MLLVSLNRSNYLTWKAIKDRDPYELVMVPLITYNWMSMENLWTRKLRMTQVNPVLWKRLNFICCDFVKRVYLSSKLAKPCSWDLWCAVRKLVDYVAAHYQEADMSIWEVRNAKQNFVYSKVMMWVALDRGLRLADKRSLPCPQRKVWEDARNNLYEDIMEKVSHPPFYLYYPFHFIKKINDLIYIRRFFAL